MFALKINIILKLIPSFYLQLNDFQIISIRQIIQLIFVKKLHFLHRHKGSRYILKMDFYGIINNIKNLNFLNNAVLHKY